jgi:aminopeptidase N
MQQRLPGLLLLLSLIPSLFLLASCDQEQPAQVGDELANESITTGNAGHSRAAVDALDLATAEARKARVSHIKYDALIDIASSDEEISGQLNIQFDLSDASSDLTLDFTGGSVSSLVVNGVAINATYNGFFIELPAANLKQGSNTIEIAYLRPYGHDGTGLHRFVDPEDGLTYLHSYLWPYYANRLLPSFDQPNLKANFSLRVIAPESWEVISMSPGTAQPAADGTRLWTFKQTPEISTYIFSLHAGPYHIWTDNSGDVPLRLMARESLAEFVAAEEWLDTTQKGMIFYNDYFDIPYPFEKYDQLIVPEFNIGGMENAAAVTFTEYYIQRQPSNREQRGDRSGTVLHELAHMWFGDLVTHDWWNGMWLNESFATQMATKSLTDTTEFTGEWHSYFTVGKKRAFQRDSRVTTHPIEMPVNSTDEFTMLYDAITYQKGGSALKQLQHRVGDENYRLGVSAYLKENSFGTTTLADFIGHQSKQSGIDLSSWSDEWLETTGFNTFTVDAACTGEELDSMTITQSASADHPQLRTHSIDLALYNFDEDDHLQTSAVIPVLIEGALTTVEVPDGQPCPAITNPNYNDWTFAKFTISADDEALLSEHLGDIADPLSRSMFLAGLYDKAMAGEMDIDAYVSLALNLASAEENMVVLEQITSSLLGAADMLQRVLPVTDEYLPVVLGEMEQFTFEKSQTAGETDLKQMWFHTFLNLVATEEGLAIVNSLLDGKTKIDGIDISSEDRWQILTILSRHEAEGIADLLAAESRRDSSDLGQRNLLSARAAAPNLANKMYWVEELQEPNELTSLAKQRAVMAELFPASQTELQLKVLEKILSSLPAMSLDADPYFLTSYTSALLTPMCTEESSALMQVTLDEYSDQLNPTALRFLREAHQADVECQQLRSMQRPMAKE